MSAGAPPLQVEHATKRFGATVAVDDVSFDLADGELLVVVGPSGCGKSTLLRSVAGLEALDEGVIRIGGEVVDDGRRRVDPERRSVGLVFQDHALFPHLTVADNVAFGMRDVRGAERRRAVAELLELLGLGGMGDRYPHEVSGGERQRVSLARAIAPRPALLLLDEPFASLDPTRRAQVRADVVRLLRQAGTPAILVTHDQAEALAVGDRIAVVHDGRLQQVDAPVAIYGRPANRFVAGFMGEARFLPLRAEGEGLGTALGPVRADRPVRASSLAVLRPTDVAFSRDVAGDATVERAEYQGATWTYELRLASGETVLSSQPRSVVVAPGTAVRAVLVPGYELVVVDDDGGGALAR
ncbi:MAG TPA: ABC transporter ATP-binding protein [Aquihabitans sp.]|nr:ABC transporter ATP-binding protein [Aquihabitans sp.]